MRCCIHWAVELKCRFRGNKMRVTELILKIVVILFGMKFRSVVGLLHGSTELTQRRLTYIHASKFS